MHKYIVVDEANHWLGVGDFDTPEEACEQAEKAFDYDEGLERYVYEVHGDETVFLPHKPERKKG